MLREPYIEDNPFRLVGRGSSTDLSRLRRLGESISKSAQVGIESNEAPLTDIFGPGQVGALRSAIRSMATNLRNLTEYRFFWPLDIMAVPYLTNKDIDPSGAFPEEELCQIMFLESWIKFIQSGSRASAEMALENWQSLCENLTFTRRLTDLLSLEDESKAMTRNQAVSEAQSLVERHILRAILNIAVISFEERKGAACTSLLMVVLDSPTDELHKDWALEPLVAAGDRAADRLNTFSRSMSAATKEIPHDATILEDLADCLEDRHPNAKSWSETVLDCNVRLANLWINRAVELSNDNNDFTTALEFLGRAKKLSVGAEVQARIRLNWETIQGNQRQAVSVGQQSNRAQSNVHPNKDSSLPIGCIIWVTIIVIGGISSLFHSDTRSSNSPGNGSELQSVSSDDLHFDNLKKNYEALHSAIEWERSAIDLESKQIENESNSIGMTLQLIKASKDTLDRTSRKSVANYNRMVDEYNAGIKQLKVRVQRAQVKLKAFNAKVDRENEMAAELNARAKR